MLLLRALAARSLVFGSLFVAVCGHAGRWSLFPAQKNRRVAAAAALKQAEYSQLADWFTPRLQDSHVPNVILAAERLGEARDTTAVPDLMSALERCVETQPPGWSECAAALANALARIGDRRALPLLYRLDNVRGIGLIPAVRNAIAAIEPQTSLLRAGQRFRRSSGSSSSAPYRPVPTPRMRPFCCAVAREANRQIDAHSLRMPRSLPSFANTAVLIVGDVMLDEYVWGDVRRISQEAAGSGRGGHAPHLRAGGRSQCRYQCRRAWRARVSGRRCRTRSFRRAIAARP